jgi:probable HAF family extracellular repeat protein
MFSFSRLMKRFRNATRQKNYSVKLNLEVLEDRTVLTTITDLGTLGGIASAATGINDLGQVVGNLFPTASGDFHAFLYSGGRMTDLGTFGGSSGSATGINDSGQVAGTTSKANGLHAVLYSGGGTTDLGTLGGNYSQGYGINASGQVVGEAYTAGGEIHAFLYSGGAMTDLGTLGGNYSQARGINDSGQVVGVSATGDGELHNFLYSGGVMTELGGIVGGYIEGYGINASGQVVGQVVGQAFGLTHAVLYSGGAMTDLGTLGGIESYGDGINDLGQVVGNSYTASNKVHAFLYSGGGMMDLNSILSPASGWELSSANAINDAGQIVGFGVHDGQEHAFLLSLALPDIAPTLTWDAAQGGVDVGYSVSGAAVTQDTTVDLYWSSSDQFADHAAFGGPIPRTVQTIAAGTAVGGSLPIHFDAATLGNPPPGATDLLAVADPDNLLGTFTQATNVKALAIPDIVVKDVSTTDSKSLTVSYDINNADVASPFTIGFYRSATSQFDPLHNLRLGTISVSGADATSGSAHSKTLALPVGLPWNTDMPYVLAVANPDNSVVEASTTNDTAFYRTYVIGAVSVGFDPATLFNNPLFTVTSDWVKEMATALKQVDGYWDAIPFSWDSASRRPQAVIDAGEQLFYDIKQRALSIPDLKPNDVIDVHLIGHSRGSVVISEVAQYLAGPVAFPQLEHGYLKMTLLDPHPAHLQYGFNADFAPTRFGDFLKSGYSLFEDEVRDPPVIVPSRVNEVDIYYQKTPTSDLTGYERTINLQGLNIGPGVQVDPFQTLTFDTNMTGPGIGHEQVHIWYMGHVVQTGALITDARVPYSPTLQIGPDVFLSGTSGNNSLLLGQTSLGNGSIVYSLDGGLPVVGTDVASFAFTGGSGNDSFTVQMSGGGTPVSGGIFFDGGPGANILTIDAGGLTVKVVPGGLTVGDPQAVSFTNVQALNLNNAAAVNTIPGPDTADRADAFIGLTAKERFVQALYLDNLGRVGATSELDGWAGMLDGSTAAQGAVAAGVLDSPEARTHLVQSWYIAFLGRQAVGGEEQGWVGLLLQGQTEEAVLSGILSSPEFYARAQTLIGSGTADERYVQALYLLLLNRTGEASGVAGWVGGLPTQGRQGVARGFLAATEFRTDLFEAYYNALLHRPDDAAGISDWVFSNLDAASVRMGFEAAPEFFTNG